MLQSIGIKAAAASPAPPPADFAGDTTYMLLDGEGPVEIRTLGPDPLTLQAPFTGPIVATRSGEQGTTRLRMSNMEGSEPFSRIDCREAAWTQSEDGSGVCRIGNFTNDPHEPPPGDQLYCAGGVIRNIAADRHRTWSENKAMSGVSHAAGLITDGWRIDNVGEDAIWTGNSRTVVMNCWISWCGDDAIDLRPGRILDSVTVRDCLLDQNFYSIALDEGSAVRDSDETFFDAVLHVENTLMRNRLVPPSGGSGVYFFKTRRPMTTRLINTVFGVSVVRDRSDDRRFREALEWCDFASGNVVCWLDPTFENGTLAGGFPVPSWPLAEMQALNAEFPGAFRLLTGQDAWDFWNAARTNWINGHPKVGRIGAYQDFPGDPESVPASYDPTAYGGKGTNMPPGYTGPEPVEI